MLNNKLLTRVVGPGAAQLVGGGPEYYTLGSDMAIFRDSFTGSTIDSDEWISTVSGSGLTSITTAGIFASSGYAIMAAETATAGMMRLTSKRTFSIPFRLTAAVSRTGFGTGGECIIQVRDTAGVTAATVSGNPTYLARFRLVGTAGGTLNSAATEVQAGGTSDSYITGAAAQKFDMSAVTGTTSGTTIGYIIDVGIDGITFATHSTNAISLATSGFTAKPLPPFILSHFPAPTLKLNQKYCVEFLVNLGSGTIEGNGGASATGAANSCFLKVWNVEVKQYSPRVGFVQRGPQPVAIVQYSTGGAGLLNATGLGTSNSYLQWS